KKIWERAWLDQAAIYTWPSTLPGTDRQALDKLRFYDPIEGNTRSAYETNYKSQVMDLYDIVRPRIVQLHAGLHWVPKCESMPPTSEDMWLAQEDVWVQRGLLQIVRETNDILAAMNVEKSASETKKTLANTTWVLDLQIDTVNGKPGLKYTLLNKSKRRQVLPVFFQVYYPDLEVADVVEVQGEPLTPGKSVTGERPIPSQFAAPRGIKNVKQLYDWRTVPVKRVDQIAMAHHSSRSAPATLQPPLQYKAPEPQA